MAENNLLSKLEGLHDKFESIDVNKLKNLKG